MINPRSSKRLEAPRTLMLHEHDVDLIMLVVIIDSRNNRSKNNDNRINNITITK